MNDSRRRSDKEKIQKKFLANQVRKLNKNLPNKRKKLSELLEEDNPTVRSKKGESLLIKKEELEKIADIVPEHLYEEIDIPVYIEVSRKYGKGTYKIKGNPECRLCRKILDMEPDIFEEEMFINKVELRKIRKELRTATEYMFTLNLTDPD